MRPRRARAWRARASPAALPSTAQGLAAERVMATAATRARAALVAPASTDQVRAAGRPMGSGATHVTISSAWAASTAWDRAAGRPMDFHASTTRFARATSFSKEEPPRLRTSVLPAATSTVTPTRTAWGPVQGPPMASSARRARV